MKGPFMSQISPAAVKALRDRTNMPMMECKAALTEAGGDMDKAITLLRTKAGGKDVKFAARETAEGRVGAFSDDSAKLGGIIELRCETAPSARSEPFTALANDLARQVALKGATPPAELLAQPFVGDAKRTVKDRIQDTFVLVRENMKPARMKQFKGITGSYVHHDGTSGAMVLVEGTKAEPQL